MTRDRGACPVLSETRGHRFGVDVPRFARVKQKREKKNWVYEKGHAIRSEKGQEEEKEKKKKMVELEDIEF